MATGSHSTVGWLKAVEMCARPSTAQWGWVGLGWAGLAGAPHDPVAALQSFSMLLSIPVLLCCRSYFNVLAHDPPTVAIGCCASRLRSHGKKDTLVNILETK